MNPSAPRLCAAVVLYRPMEEEVVCNVRSYSDDVDLLLLVDNSEFGYTHEGRFRMEFPHARYIRLCENRGIASALNVAFAEAGSVGASWVLTMDQDSSFPEPSGFRDYLGGVDRAGWDSAPLFCPMYPGESTDSSQFWTSGALVSLCAWRDVGGFDERLFIDEVDGDFSYRLRITGHHLVKIHDTRLRHKLGEPIRRRIAGRWVSSDNHSALRKYYIARNRVYLMLRRPDMLGSYLGDSIKKLITFLLVEADRPHKLAMVFKGVLHGIVGRMGKYPGGHP